MTIKILKKGNNTAVKPSAAVLLSNKLIEQATGVKDFHNVDKKIPKVVKKKPLTLRDKKVVALVASGGTSKAKILMKAGYSEKTARTPSKVFDKPEVQDAIEPILARLIRHRDKVLERMEALVGTAGYTSLSITMANMNKDIQLLSGLPTSREEYTLPEEERNRLKELLDMNKSDAN